MDTDSLISYFSKINMSLTDSCTPEVLAEIVRRHAESFGEKAGCENEIQLLASVLEELGCGVERITITSAKDSKDEPQCLLNVRCPNHDAAWIVDAHSVGLPLRYEFGNWQAKDDIHFTFAQHEDMVELVRWDENLDSIVCTFKALAA